MKQLLPLFALVAGLLIAWFLRGCSDTPVLKAKDAEILALRDTIQTKDKLLAQGDKLLEARNVLIASLQEQIKSDDGLLTTNQALLAADKTEYAKLQKADQTIINSLKDDNQAEIQTLKSQLQDRDSQIAQLNQGINQTVARYETQLNELRNQIANSGSSNDGDKIYPKDNGFEAQDMGSGFSSYQVFGPITNPSNAPIPSSVPNRTPWVFGGSNAGIAANGSPMLLVNAKNGDHEGSTSQSGQAAFLQFKGSWFSQMIKLPAGTYSVSFDYEARPQYGEANGVAVSLNGTDVFVGAPTDTANFVHVTTDSLTLSKAKSCELKFRGLGALNDPDGDHTTFIDNVCVNILGGQKHEPKSAPPEFKATSYQSDTLNGTIVSPPKKGE